MNVGFWIGILVLVLAVVGLTVVFAGMVSHSRRTRRRPDPRDPITALKASGALRHRKSSRP